MEEFEGFRINVPFLGLLVNAKGEGEGHCLEDYCQILPLSLKRRFVCQASVSWTNWRLFAKYCMALQVTTVCSIIFAVQSL